MNKFLEKFEKYQKEIIIGISIFSLILLSLTLFLGNFNLIKILIFIEILILVLLFFLFYHFLKTQPKEEKISFFSLIQNLLDTLQEGVVIYDEERKIIFVNKAFTDLVGLKKEDLINFKVEEWQTKNKKYEMLVNIFFPFLKGEDIKILSQNPEILKAKFSSPKEKYFLISYLDIFLEKKYKLRIVLDRTEDIIESERRLELAELLSHHLFTPLNEIRWQLEAISQEKLDEENKEFLNSALRIIKNATIFASSISSFVSLETKKPELKIQEVDLEKTILFILDLLKEKIEEKKIKVEIEISEKAKKVVGDENLLTLALFSLIENGVIYNKIGGKLFINLKKLPERPYVEIEIKDTGIGMSKEDLFNLFKKYYRGKKAKEVDIKGIGIGLYHSKNIIELHGGEIKVESEEDKGTEVLVYLTIDPVLIPRQN